MLLILCPQVGVDVDGTHPYTIIVAIRSDSMLEINGS